MTPIRLQKIGIVGVLVGLLIAFTGLWWQVECDAGRKPCKIDALAIIGLR